MKAPQAMGPLQAVELLLFWLFSDALEYNMGIRAPMRIQAVAARPM